MSRQSCPFHADDDVAGIFVSAEVGERFTCERAGHLKDGVFEWVAVPDPPQLPGIGGLAEELGLASELSAALAELEGTWVEYGVLEHRYASRRPDDFNHLVATYGHTAIEKSSYTASSYLSRTLGGLARAGRVALRFGTGTGRWSYNQPISYWCLADDVPWDDAHRLPWSASGCDVSYVPGQVEV